MRLRLSQRSWKAVFFLVLSSALTLASVVFALDVPPLTGRIVDLAHVLPPNMVESLTARLKAHEETTSNQVTVLVLPSLEEEPLESFSHRVATTWKLGQQGTDNGVLLSQFPRRRNTVGKGFERFLF